MPCRRRRRKQKASSSQNDTFVAGPDTLLPFDFYKICSFVGRFNDIHFLETKKSRCDKFTANQESFTRNHPRPRLRHASFSLPSSVPGFGVHTFQRSGATSSNGRKRLMRMKSYLFRPGGIIGRFVVSNPDESREAERNASILHL